MACPNGSISGVRKAPWPVMPEKCGLAIWLYCAFVIVRVLGLLARRWRPDLIGVCLPNEHRTSREPELRRRARVFTARPPGRCRMRSPMKLAEALANTRQNVCPATLAGFVEDAFFLIACRLREKACFSICHGR